MRKPSEAVKERTPVFGLFFSKEAQPHFDLFKWWLETKKVKKVFAMADLKQFTWAVLATKFAVLFVSVKLVTTT
jgi:hypothetical protein